MTFTAPTNRDLYPPGYYMLFYVNNQGQPSIAKMVRLGEPSASRSSLTSRALSPGPGSKGINPGTKRVGIAQNTITTPQGDFSNGNRPHAGGHRLSTDPAIKPLLSDLQGNIFKPHGRKHSAYLVVTFLPDQSQEIRHWIRNFATYYVTTAADQIKDARRYRELKVDAGLFGNFFLSAKGYEVLGFHRGPNPQR